jgi:hypothetical protein
MWAKHCSRDGCGYRPLYRVAAFPVWGPARATTQYDSRPMEAGRTQDRLSAALDPRERIYRDPFNELVIFVISAIGAAILAPVVLLIVGAIVGEFGIWVFVAASVAIELVLIFGIGRPQMKPRERLGWALLWGFTAAVLGAAFWELVFKQSV